MVQPTLHLKGFTYEELFQPEGLRQLDDQFLNYLHKQNEFLCHTLLKYRENISSFGPVEVSDLLLACAPILEQFIAELFDIEPSLIAANLATKEQDPIFVFKAWFVLRQARRELKQVDGFSPFEELDIWLDAQLESNGLESEDRELAVAKLGVIFLEKPADYDKELKLLVQWCVHVLTDANGQGAVKNWVSFRLPGRLDYQRLVPMEAMPDDSLRRFEGVKSDLRLRDGFKLTDPRMTSRQVLNEIHYCVYCHQNDGDFCSKGFPVKKNSNIQEFKINPLGETLTGCPLEEKISEMHSLKKDGFTIAALAVIMVDNPMCPATGHRICNDCMKGCIYQKQDPVNIPQTETGILTDVLNLPWGVEIYDLLTRWNPLRHVQWVAKPYNGTKILIAGMGPAGFTLAHHLLMEGCAVVGTDGLKIEPLPEQLLKQPIYKYEDLKESLGERIMTGFGGVAEYGITVRWDKNFLKLIYISLMRRPYFQVFGGVRFGGTITVPDAWDLGFDHLAIAVGAGLPRELPISGSMAPGMRQANDFLMALQLTGAAKRTSLANLQVQLPAVIIGGGLTGIDTATEVQAYYIAQVEKMLERYETLAKVIGEARIREHFDEQSLAMLQEFLTHGKAVRVERERAAKSNDQVNFINLIRSWGGVTVTYRRQVQESPAYKRNHEEITKALEEGIYYAEGLEPIATHLDQFGHVEALACRSRIKDEKGNWVLSDEEHIIPARSIFVATGAKPNIAYDFEHRGTFKRVGNNYQRYDLQNNKLIPVETDGNCKSKVFGAFTSYDQNDQRVSFLGDTHPIFHGSVVKAIASAKRTYPLVIASLKNKITANNDGYKKFVEQMRDKFLTRVVSVARHAPNVIEIKIHAPMACKNFQPGHFYRIQNYETSASVVNGTRLQTEAMAMTGAGVDQEKGEVTLLVFEQGASSRLVATLKPNDPIAMMGPTGVRTKINHQKETILIIGSGISVANMRALGPAMRAAGNRVLYIACLQSAEEVHCQDELEQATDVIIWITQSGNPIEPRRSQDRSATGEFMNVLMRYAMGEFEPGPDAPEIPLEEVDRVIVVGYAQLIREVQKARGSFLKNYFVKQPQFVASIYGPMQCMLKGVCAQCLQWQIDPETGKRTKAVYACSWQDQPLDIVDLDNLDERLIQNRTQEILTNLWLDYLLSHYRIEKI